MRILDSKEKSTQILLESAPKFQDFISESSNKFLQNLIDAFKDQCNIQIDHSLVRGLDYYSGIVFEAVSEDLGAQDAFLGGVDMTIYLSNLGVSKCMQLVLQLALRES